MTEGIRVMPSGIEYILAYFYKLIYEVLVLINCKDFALVLRALKCNQIISVSKVHLAFQFIFLCYPLYFINSYYPT